MSNATAFIASVSAALGLLGTLLRFVVKGWRAISIVMDKIDDTAERVTSLEEKMKVNAHQRATESKEIKDKLEE